MIGQLGDAASFSASKRAFPQDFECHGALIKAFAEHSTIGSPGVSLCFEREMGTWRENMGRDSAAFTLLNYQRLDALETRVSIAREAYRIIRRMAGQKELGPDAIPDGSVMKWVCDVCDELGK